MRKDVELVLHNPGVTFQDKWGDGTNVGATLHAWKEMRDGTERLYTIKLSDLDVSELACIARSAAQAFQCRVAGERKNLDRQETRAKGVWDGR